MGSGAKLVRSQLKQGKSKSLKVQHKSKKSCTSDLPRRTPTKGKHVSKQKRCREAVRIKKLNNSTMESGINLGRKHRRKFLEEDIKTEEVTEVANSEVIIPAHMSSFIGMESPHPLLLDKVQSSVSAMLQLKDAKASLMSKSVPLFMNDGLPVYLVVQCIRVPKMCTQHFRFCLPHPLVDESSDVCLFVPDLKKGKNEDHEMTIEYYKELLEKNSITGISQVMPLRQVKVEYDTYELCRRLLSQFELFLSDGRIAGHILHLLGNAVYKRRKLPVPVDMRAKNLKQEFERALSKTLMVMNANGNKAAVKVGHTKQSVTQIAENIMAVAECLSKRYPGGWDNIRSLHIHLQNSPLIPVYITLKSSNEVNVPTVGPVIPKKARQVEGELTTFPGTQVTVMPSGEVIVKKIGLTKEDKEMGFSDSDWEEFNSDEEMDAGSGDEIPEKTKVEPQPISEEEEKVSEDADDGNDHVVEAAEDAYLSEWRKQWNANIKENNKRKQNEASDGKEEPKEKKQKLVKDKRKKQKETSGKKKQRNHIAIKEMEKSQPDSKANNDGEEEPEEKKQKVVKNKRKKQIEGKKETIGKKIQRKDIAIKEMDKSQPDSKANDGEEEPEEKKQKIVKNKRKKQEEIKGKNETIGKKKQRKHIAIKEMGKSQPDSKKCQLFKKNKTKLIGTISIPNRNAVQKKVNKGKKNEHRRTISTKLATKKSKAQKTKPITSHQNTSMKWHVL